MTDLTPDKLDQIKKAATRRQVVQTYVNGEPDGTTNAVLALVARVRELEAQVERVRIILDDAASGGALTAYERRAAIDEALQALGEKS